MKKVFKCTKYMIIMNCSYKQSDLLHDSIIHQIVVRKQRSLQRFADVYNRILLSVLIVAIKQFFTIYLVGSLQPDIRFAQCLSAKHHFTQLSVDHTSRTRCRGQQVQVQPRQACLTKLIPCVYVVTPTEFDVSFVAMGRINRRICMVHVFEYFSEH